MSRARAFEVVFDVLALEQMDAIERKSHSLIRKAVDDQLAHDPDVATRNRKPLVRDTAIGATWEVRCGPGNRFRIFYDITAMSASSSSWRSRARSESGSTWGRRGS